jgi:HPt (histidine-containing phosphotransfer) domain-containing protein
MSANTDDLQRARRRVRGPVAGATPHVPVIDVEHLRGFTGGNVQLERDLGTLFLATAKDYLDRMGGALEVGGDWSAAAHALKGASANLGAARVAMLAAAAEAAAPSADAITALRRAVEEVRAFFECGQD